MRKREQLGMDPGTASHRLVKDILFDFISRAGHRCFHCGGVMDRGNFSIEHRVPWLDSADPKGLFFDLDNIAYSHHACNITAARRLHKLHLTDEERKAHHAATERKRWTSLPVEQQREIRRGKYLRNGV